MAEADADHRRTAFSSQRGGKDGAIASRPGVLAAALSLSACPRAAAAWSILGGAIHSRVDRWRRDAVSAAMMADAAGATPRGGETGQRLHRPDSPCGFERRDAGGLARERSRSGSRSGSAELTRPNGTRFGAARSARGGGADDSIAVAPGHDAAGAVTCKVGWTHAPWGRPALDRPGRARILRPPDG